MEPTFIQISRELPTIVDGRGKPYPKKKQLELWRLADLVIARLLGR